MLYFTSGNYLLVANIFQLQDSNWTKCAYRGKSNQRAALTGAKDTNVNFRVQYFLMKGLSSES